MLIIPRPKTKIQHNSWLKEHDDLLAQYAAGGYFAQDAAQKLGRTYDATKVRASKLGIKFRRSGSWTDFEERLLSKYAETGRSQAYAAREMGRSVASVALKASRLGVKFHAKPGNSKGSNGGVSRARLQWRFH